MSTEQKNPLAVQTYRTMLSALEDRNWKYVSDDEKLLAHFRVNGDDIPLNFLIRIDEKREVVKLTSPMPFHISEERRIEGAVAACAASYGMTDGCFEIDLSDGMLLYRISTSFTKSVLGKGAFHHLIDCTCALVDHYNDLFLALDKGIITLSDFIAKAQ